jgi:hypothetical protein
MWFAPTRYPQGHAAYHADGAGNDDQASRKEQLKMSRRWLLLLAALVPQLTQVGCGNPAGLYSVSGTVRHQGEPAAGAVVYFHHEGPAAPSSPTIPFGIVEDDGSFTLTCDDQGTGCPPGKYAVLVEWRDRAGDGVVPVKTTGKTKLVKRSRVRSGPDRLGGRYFDISKPLLHAEVLPQSNTLPPFELGG